MPLSDEDIRKYTEKLLLSRFRILSKHSFFGVLLMKMKYGLDSEAETAYTDGEYIKFGPKFLDDLSSKETDFIMMHELMHVVLKHCYRGNNYDPYLFNIACDIVVNSNILKSYDMDKSYITLKKYGESMHLTPNLQEGYLYTAEEVYQMLLKIPIMKGKNGPNKNGNSNGSGSGNQPGNKSKSKGGNGNGSGGDYNIVDDHSKWKESKEKEEEMDNLVSSLFANSSNICGTGCPGIDRMIDEFRNPTVDWRQLLNDFLSFDINDYSFNPPDRRYDGDFYLPDFNVLEEKELSILFAVDTSGSVSNDMLKTILSEIKGALDQFKGKLKGYLGFFDSAFYGPKPFDNVDDFIKIRPVGGGGTSFHVIFDEIPKIMNMTDYSLKAIIILTDGYAEVPDEEESRNIPVFWMIVEGRYDTYMGGKFPWGTVAKIKVK